MARVKRAVNAQKKRRTVLKASKGYRGQRSRLYRKAKEQQLHSLTYAYRDRRARKGEFRKLWISRINAAARANDITYNRLIQGLKAAGVEVDRKNLAEIAVSDPAAFTALVEVAKGGAARGRQRAVRRGRRALRRCSLLTERSARVAAAVKLHRHVGRRRAARFLAEGPNLVEAALRARSRVGGLRHRGRVGAIRVRLLARCPGPPGDRARRKSVVRHRHSGRAGGGVRVPRRALADVLADSPRLVAVAVGDLRTRQRGHADPHRRRDGRGRRGAGRAQRRPLQRQVPARIGRQHLLDPGGRRDPTPPPRSPRCATPGLQVLATTVDGEVSLDDADLAEPTAWLFGPEAHGLCPAKSWPAIGRPRVRIPMPGAAERRACNVASAAARSACTRARRRAASHGR